jgi:hypothetical protein
MKTGPWLYLAIAGATCFTVVTPHDVIWPWEQERCGRPKPLQRTTQIKIVGQVRWSAEAVGIA